MGDLVLETTVVGQNEQSFAVGVEPARWIDAGDGNEVLQGLARATGTELAGDPEGLVEQQDAAVVGAGPRPAGVAISRCDRKREA